AQRPDDSESRRKVFTCHPTLPAQDAACAKQILTTLARRAYRRPATAAELATLTTFFDEGRRGATFDDGIEFALRFVLTAPPFLVRAEREPGAIGPGQPYRISDVGLASRLSFFLCSSRPGAERL